MKLHLHRKNHETEDSLRDAEHTGYDAQTDLALHHTGHEEDIDTGVGMLGGMVAPTEQHPGYDAARDTGIDP